MKKIIPENFRSKYQKILGKDEYLRFENACKKPLRKCIRVNTLKISVSEFKKLALQKNWELSPIPWTKTGFFIDRKDRSEPLGKSFLHLSGYFYIQEASSMLPTEILEPKSGEIVLDFSAAPGSKTTQMAALMNNEGIILANEISATRLKALASNLERSGLTNSALCHKDGRAFSQYFANFFDKILLDAPCSSEGTIRKDPLALKDWNDKKVRSIADIQFSLITHAFLSLKPGGTMVYSTCTLSPEENEDIIKRLLSDFEGKVEIVPITESWVKKENKILPGTLRVWPQDYDTEGFFVAKIRKTGETENSSFIDSNRNSPFSDISKKSQNLLKKFLAETFGLEKISFENFSERGNEVWIRPAGIEKIAQKISLSKSGFLFATIYPKKIQLSHSAALYLYNSYQLEKGLIKLNLEDAQAFQAGKDLRINVNTKFVICCYEKIPLGLAKVINGKLKNQLPRHFVI